MKMRYLAAALAAATLATSVAHAQDLNSDKGKLSYYFGYRAGGNLAGLAGQGEQIDINAAIKGMQDAYAKKEPSLTEAQLKPAIEAFQKRMEQRNAKAKADFEKAAAANKVESTKVLNANKTKPGVATLPGGVQYRVIEKGTGARAALGSTVALDINGPYAYGQAPANNQGVQSVPAIKVSEIQLVGLREAIMQMPAGSRWEITLPPEKAFGDQPNPDVPPNVVVQFDLKVKSVK